MTPGNCTRCGGTGSTVFRHVENGRCFACEGTGSVESSDRPDRPARRGHWDPYYHLRTLYSAARSHMAAGDQGSWPITDDDGGCLSLLAEAFRTVDPETARKARAAFLRIGCGATLECVDAIARGEWEFVTWPRYYGWRPRHGA